jgi:hypothetical protein
VTRFFGWPLFALLLGLALAIGLAAGPDDATSQVPSVTNAGPRGLKVLVTWLSEAGFDVRSSREPLTRVPVDVRTVVLPAATASEVDEGETAALQEFVQRGGTLVVLTSRVAFRGPLKRWLRATSGEAPELEAVAGDGSGAFLRVTLPLGAFAGLTRLRVASEPSITLERPDAVPLTVPAAAFWVPEGKGEVYVLAGADVGENARLALADNARLWANLAARGPMLFDESHHLARASTTPTVNLWATGLQFLFAAAIFVWARSPRLGPARPEAMAPQRSTTEYVEAMARLTEGARVEPALVEALRQEVRLELTERLGIAGTRDDADRVRELSLRLKLTAAEAQGLFTETDFLQLSRRVARLEALLAGRRVDG